MNELKPIYCYRATVVKVIDGDTVSLDIDLGLHTWRKDEHVRLLGINARETKKDTKIQGDEDTAHLITLLWKHALRTHGDDREGYQWDVIIETQLRKGVSKEDKYGRLLVTLWGKTTTGSINLNQQMLADGFAVPSPESWSK